MCGKGNCWNNASQESFFEHMKNELNPNRCETFAQFKSVIDESMKYYNGTLSVGSYENGT
ncbi:IS3 family transposase [Clostridium mobile]|nr:IS3 family transposase [Clostridium mobile]